MWFKKKFDEEDREYRRIRRHADKHSKGKLAESVFVSVHPFYHHITNPFYHPDSESPNGMSGKFVSEMLERAATTEPDEARDLAGRIADSLHPDRPNGISDPYMVQLVTMLYAAADSSTSTVLVESPLLYWHGSDLLVEKGLFDLVIVSPPFQGLADDRNSVLFSDLIATARKGYLTGTYAARCAGTFGRELHRVGVEVVPVVDLLLDPYKNSADWLKDLQGLITNASERAINSTELVFA